MTKHESMIESKILNFSIPYCDYETDDFFYVIKLDSKKYEAFLIDEIYAETSLGIFETIEKAIEAIEEEK